MDRTFMDRTLSISQGISAFRHSLLADHVALLQHAMSLLDGWMLFNDPPTHTRLRDPVQRSFSPAMVERLVPRSEGHARVLLNGRRQSSWPADKMIDAIQMNQLQGE